MSLRGDDDFGLFLAGVGGMMGVMLLYRNVVIL